MTIYHLDDIPERLRKYFEPVPQIGLEKTPEEYVAQMVAVFREVKRVLRKDGTLWLNLGDSYGRAPEKGGSGTFNGRNGNGDGYAEAQHLRSESSGSSDGKVGRGERAAVRNGSVKPKDLCGIPWLVAFALRADGWYLRQDIIWAKPNPMPESVSDRCTKAHEYIFLLTKSARYFYDAEAIKESCLESDSHPRGGGLNPKALLANQHARMAAPQDPRHANGVGWGYSGGKPRTKATGPNSRQRIDRDPSHLNGVRPKQNESFSGAVNNLVTSRNKRSVWEMATSPFPEAHFATFPPELIKPCILAGCPSNGTVLDPFFGAGTTGLVSSALNCQCIGIELNQEYLEIAAKRLSQSVFQFSPETETEPELQQSLLGPDEEKKRNL